MKNLKKLFAVAAPAAIGMGAAVAQSTGANATDFDAIVTVLSDWLEGSLGTVIALGALGVGLAMGVTNQSIMAVVIGIAMALAVSFGPGVLTNISGSGLAF